MPVPPLTPTTQVQFVDEDQNPLPPGIYVTIYGIAENTNRTIIIQGYTLANGWMNVPTPFPVFPSYIAYFVGNQAPRNPQAFQASTLEGYYDSGEYYDAGFYYDSTSVAPSIITVLGYRSPYQTYQVYGDSGSLLQPLGWYSSSALVIGGVLHSVMRGALAGLGSDDVNLRIIHTLLRLQSCTGAQIDSWAYDMVGPMFQRFQSESDAEYLPRLELMIGRPRCTIAAITAMVQAFYNSIQHQGASPVGNKLAFGLAGGFNTSGGFNVNPPAPSQVPSPSSILVWDNMTSPNLAALFGVVPTQFVIQIGNVTAQLGEVLAFNQFGAYDISGAYNIYPSNAALPLLSRAAPDARLGVIIAIITKAAGTLPLYLSGQ